MRLRPVSSGKYLSKALDLISELPDGHPKSLLLKVWTKKRWVQETHSIYEKYWKRFTNLLIYNSNIHKPLKQGIHKNGTYIFND